MFRNYNNKNASEFLSCFIQLENNRKRNRKRPAVIVLGTINKNRSECYPLSSFTLEKQNVQYFS